MPQVKSGKFGVEGLVVVLNELANSEAESFEDGTLEVYGEDAQGREGSTTVSVNDIAFEALAVIEELRKKEEILDLIIRRRCSVIPEYDGGWHVELFDDESEAISEADRLDLDDAVKVAVFRATGRKGSVE